VLRIPENATRLESLGLPPAWTAQWEAALDKSDADFEAVKSAREEKASHIVEGQDAEVEFVELMIRLRRYLDSRASRRDRVKQAENKEILQPLLDALKKLSVERAARATRRKNAEAEEG